MAGAQPISKSDQKKHILLKNGSNNEILKESSANSAPKKITLRGILGLNQPISVNRESSPSLWTKENFGLNYIAEQEKVVLQKKQEELERAIVDLQKELKHLAHSTDSMDKNLEKAAIENIPQASEYQISFLLRLKNLIIDFRKNINEASCWLESFNTKKKKKNYFWSTAMDKKKGGQQFMFSDEHSAARSVA